ncbi:hypothetical protein D3C84_566050 [compost metagenome]
MTIKTEGFHAGEFLLSEANGTRSREEITLAATGAVLPAGQVLGRVTASGHYAAYDPDATDGSEAAAAVLWAPVGISVNPQRSVGIVRDAELKRALLTGLDTDAEDLLAAFGIIAR